MRTFSSTGFAGALALTLGLLLAGCGAPSDSPTYRNRHVDHQDPVYPAKPLGQEGHPYKGYEPKSEMDQSVTPSDAAVAQPMSQSSQNQTTLHGEMRQSMHSGEGMAMMMSAALKDIHAGVAAMHPTQGNQATGTVRFTEVEGGVRVVADFQGLTPSQKHGFHIHEFGDCTAPDATSAGGHYDPQDTKHHDQPAAMHRHAGDMGNLDADAQGNAHLDMVLKDVTLTGHNAILGRGVIVHAKPDDFGQPTGNAGGRVACGVIGVAGK